MKSERLPITDEMLVKYLLDETSESEGQQVKNWIDQSAENKKYYHQLGMVWEKSANILPKNGTIDTQAAWERFTQRTQSMPRTIPLYRNFNWLKIAAILVLLAGAGSLVYYVGYRQTERPLANHQAPITPSLPEVGNTNVTVQAAASLKDTTEKMEVALKQPPRESTIVAQKRSKTHHTHKSQSSAGNVGFICNNTPCPIEICIVQSVKCKDDKMSEVSTCSVLEPDQSGQLHYKAYGKIASKCKATIDEIRITRVSTGETIVLNSSSSPATAQEFFNYITGEKKGDIVAGIFHTDCNNQGDDCGLKFDNNYGNLFLQ